jgi:integrase
MAERKKRPTGIELRHARRCPSRARGPCGCQPTYQANVWSARDGKRIRKTFAKLSEAKGWRRDALHDLARGVMRAPTRKTLGEAADEWLEGAREGTITKRSGQQYKPSTLRGYDQALRDFVLPDFAGARLSAIARTDVQDFADRLRATGLDASTIRNAVAPLRVIFRRAVARGVVAVNPTSGLELPTPEGKRDRIADPGEATRLLAVLPEPDRPVWATALYAGLRRGELLALRWEHVDLGRGVIRVAASWDVKEGVVEPKSRAGHRSVPIAAVLRDYLIGHKLRSGRSEGLAFGRSAETPFDPRALARRAATAWKNAKPKVEPIGLHECRHTFASLMIAAGVNAKALSTYMGHSSITVTLDRYGHLMPGMRTRRQAGSTHTSRAPRQGGSRR